MTRKLLLAAALGCSLAGFAAGALAKPGDPDPDFVGGCGVPVRLPELSAVLVAADGKIWEVGTNLIVRCMPDGSADTSFGSGGFGVYAPTRITFSGQAAKLQPDGRLVIAGAVSEKAQPTNRGIGLMRINVDGFPDQTFGVYTDRMASNSSAPQVTDVIVQPDGTFVVAATAATSPAAALLLRFGADGSLDTTFGDSGFARMAEGAAASLRNANSVLRQSDGKLVVAGTAAAPPPGMHTVAALARFGPDGTLDMSFGNGGVAAIDFRPTHDSTGTSVAQLANDRLVAAGAVSGDGVQSAGVAVARLRANGELDPTFGYGGKAIVPSSTARRADLNLAPDGKLVLVANPSPVYALRLTADGVLDASFGSGGRLFIPTLGPPVRSATQPDNKLVVARTSIISFALSRYLLAGPSTTTSLQSSAIPSALGEAITLTSRVAGQNPAGTVEFRIDGAPVPACQAVVLATGTVDTIATCTFVPALAGAHTLAALYSGDTSNPSSQSLELTQLVSAPGTETAIEFYHADFDHYFTTTVAAEVGKLDSGVSTGWQRTGRFFPVWPLATSGTQPVCRFFSGQRFAPKSSHFYTPYAAECVTVKASPDWLYEGDVMAFKLPDGSGNCAAGDRPLYREYNGGQGGAPNHRYYTDANLRAEMTYRGWTSEGHAATRVFACVPAGASQ